MKVYTYAGLLVASLWERRSTIELKVVPCDDICFRPVKIYYRIERSWAGAGFIGVCLGRSTIELKVLPATLARAATRAPRRSTIELKDQASKSGSPHHAKGRSTIELKGYGVSRNQGTGSAL